MKPHLPLEGVPSLIFAQNFTCSLLEKNCLQFQHFARFSTVLKLKDFARKY